MLKNKNRVWREKEIVRYIIADEVTPKDADRLKDFGNKLINEIEVGKNGAQLLETIRRAYKKAPYFNHTFPLVESILLNKEKNLARYLGDSLIKIASYLDIELKLLYHYLIFFSRYQYKYQPKN